MNISKLEQGMVIKNYKELCALLEVEPLKANSKKAQLKELERHLRYSKNGQKITIEEIYDEVKEKQDGRKEIAEDDLRHEGNTSIYREDISSLIINLLAQSNSNKICVSISKLLNQLKMTNDNYSHGRRNVPKLSELIDIPEEQIYLFYNSTQTKLKNNVETALNYLRRKSMIIWNTQLTVCTEQVSVELNELGNPRVSNGRIEYKIMHIHRPATVEEIDLILKVEKEVRDELNCNDLKDIFVKGLWNTFTKKVNKKIKYDANIEYYYNSYVIVFNQDNVLEELSELKQLITERSLNSNIVHSLKDSSKKSNERAKEKISNYQAERTTLMGKPLKNKELSPIINLKGDEKYVENNNKLIYTVVDIQAENIVKKLYEKTTVKEQNTYESNEDNNEIPF